MRRSAARSPLSVTSTARRRVGQPVADARRRRRAPTSTAAARRASRCRRRSRPSRASAAARPRRDRRARRRRSRSTFAAWLARSCSSPHCTSRTVAVEVLVHHRELVARVLVADVGGDVVALRHVPVVRGDRPPRRTSWRSARYRSGTVRSHMVDVAHMTDPGCPWAWSASPAIAALRWRYGDGLRWRNVMIGLTESAEQYEQRGYTPLRSAIGLPEVPRYGMPFASHVKSRVSATAPACRAVVAARLRHPGLEWWVFRALQIAQFTSPAGSRTEPRCAPPWSASSFRRTSSSERSTTPRSSMPTKPTARSPARRAARPPRCRTAPRRPMAPCATRRPRSCSTATASG